MKTRKLKLTDRRVRGTFHDLYYPRCNIQGAWLRKIGFEIGDTVRVDYQPGKIIITKDAS